MIEPPAKSKDAHAYELHFGPFRLLPSAGMLLKGDEPVRLGGRGFAILAMLAERAGQTVSNDELFAGVWPTTTVHEHNLHVQITGIRKALADGAPGEGLIASVPGQGYRLTAPISRVAARGLQAAAPNNTPALLTRVYGRDEAIAMTCELLGRYSLVTIVGAGGIGKTTVALAVAQRLSPKRPIWFVDLALVANGRGVPGAIAAAVGSRASPDVLDELQTFLSGKAGMLVLDNCEHVIEACATIAEALLAAAPDLRILATSRESFRAVGEQVLRLTPLTLPPATCASAEVAMQYGAIALFIDRATARTESFALTDATTPGVTEVCRYLDGIPLAIELAAAMVAQLGLRGILEHLTALFGSAIQAKRTSLRRHSTLTAALDWSYQLLADTEKRLLRRLAVFNGAFSLGMAHEVAGEAGATEDESLKGLFRLSEKSLLNVDLSGDEASYRLLQMTRAYASAKLCEAGEQDVLRRRHAEFYLSAFEAAEPLQDDDGSGRGTTRAYTDNVGAALDWAFSPSGDAPLGIALTAAALPLWFAGSQLGEAGRRIDIALEAAGGSDFGQGRQEMKLLVGRATVQLYTRGHEDGLLASWRRVLAIAEDLGDADYQMRALWGLWTGHTGAADHAAALEAARRLQAVASESGGAVSPLIADRMMAYSLHYMGDQSGAKRHVEHMLKHYAPPTPDTDRARLQYDQRVLASATLAYTHWLLGAPETALRIAEDNVRRAQSLGHALSLCSALGQAACPIAILNGAFDKAAHFIALMKRESSDHALDLWTIWAEGFEGALAVAQGDPEYGSNILAAALDRVPNARIFPRSSALFGTLAEAFGTLGRTAEAFDLVDGLIRHADQTGEAWWKAEFLRINADLGGIAADGAPGAEALLKSSLDLARTQSALALELRTATSLARLWASGGRADHARALLRTTMARFHEGFETFDFRAAQQVLNSV